MTSKIECNICKELAGVGAKECGSEYQELVTSGANTILSGKNFTVIPSAGPLNNTHVMLVPLKHGNSFAELSINNLEEASTLLEKLQRHIQKKTNKKLFFFESGAGELTNHSGGCITHAHIHCILESPAFFDLLSKDALITPVKYMDFSSADKKHGYIWFMNSSKETYICNKPLLPSQFLRYIYAQSSDRPNIWNWRNHSNFSPMKDVIKTYQGIF